MSEEEKLWDTIELNGERGIALPIDWYWPLRPIGGECCSPEDHENDPEEVKFSTSGDNHKLTKLIGNITIAGVDHHIEAWEVRYVEHPGSKEKDHVSYGYGEQVPVCEAENSYYAVTEHMTQGAGATVEINGRHYFVVVTPFQE